MVGPTPGVATGRPGERDGELDSLLESAAHSLERGDGERAVTLAEAALALEPDNADALAIVTFARFRARKTLRPDSGGARRRLTVVFCDVVGSTELASRLDPEDTREVLRRYQGACAEVIESFGGTVAHFIGDGILAYFGFPLAHEDDAARAVLAGRAMVQAVDGLHTLATEPSSTRLAIRVGIHTGLVVVADMGAGRKVETHDLVGETPNLAARIQGEAAAGQVLISDATYALARPFVEASYYGEPVLKGVSRPVPLYTVLGERAVPSRFEATAGLPSQIVGRLHERSTLHGAWERSKAHGAAVFLHGEAGVGKSRLVRDATDRALDEGAQVLIVQCSSLHMNDALWPVIRALRPAIGSADDVHNPAAVADASGLDDPADIDALTAMLSSHGDEAQVSPASPQHRREQRFGTLVRWADQRASRQSLLVVVEDLHWADPTTVELLRRLVDRSPLAPMLLLITSRVEIPFEAPRLETLPLRPLSSEECAQLVDQLVFDESMRESVREAVISRSDGVPLYIEELTKVVVESGSAAIDVDDDEGQVPIALHDLLVARIDQFEAQREVAQALATFGQPTTSALLSSVLGHSEARVQRDIEELVAGGLVRRTGDRYEFVHVLLRDAAQRLQLRRGRRALHSRIAATFEHDAAGDGELDGVIAHHHEQAAQYEPAALGYLRSAQRQAASAGHQEAIGNFARARQMSLLASESPSDGFDLEVASGLAASLLAAHGYPAPEVAAAYEQVRVMAGERASSEHLAAVYGLWAYHHVRGYNRMSAPLAEQVMELARAEGRPGDVEAAAAVLGYQRMWCGDLAGARTELVSGLARPSSLGTGPLPHDPASGAAVNLALALCLLGEDGAAREMVAEAIARASSLDATGAAFTSAYVHAFAAEVFSLMGDPTSAIESAQKAMAISSQYGFATWLGVGWVQLSIAMVAVDPSPENLAGLREARHMWDMTGALSGMSDLLRALASGLRRAGELDEAMQVVEDGLNHVEVGDERFLEAELLRLRGLLLIEARGDRSAGLGELRHAVAVAQSQGARAYEAAALASLLDVTAEADGIDTAPLQDRLRELQAFFNEHGAPSSQPRVPL